MKNIPLKQIRIDGGTQTRAAISQDTVQEYAEAVLEGAKFPPVDVFHDGVETWLADGFHRYHAHKRAEVTDIPATVHTGSLDDALVFALGANAKNGLRRTNEDKRKCVELALGRFADRSDRWIAEACGVSNVLVSKIRPQLLTVNSSKPTAQTRTGSDGKKRKAPQPRSESPAAATPYPVEEPELSEEAVAAGEQAEKDSENLWLLKSTWKKATKKDRTAFFKWVHQQQTH